MRVWFRAHARSGPENQTSQCFAELIVGCRREEGADCGLPEGGGSQRTPTPTMCDTECLTRTVSVAVSRVSLCAWSQQ
eukprot:1471856-Rhodomonas_salina.1